MAAIPDSPQLHGSLSAIIHVNWAKFLREFRPVFFVPRDAIFIDHRELP